MVSQVVSAQVFMALCVATLATLVTSAPTLTAPSPFNGSTAATSTANLSTPRTPGFVISRIDFTGVRQIPAVGLLFLAADVMGKYANMPFDQPVLGANQYTNDDQQYPRALIVVGAHLPRSPRYPFRVKHVLWGLWLCTVKWVITDMNLGAGYCKLQMQTPTGLIWMGSLVYRTVTEPTNQTATLPSDLPDDEISTAPSSDTILTSREQIPPDARQQDLTSLALPIEHPTNNRSVVVGMYRVTATPLLGGQRIVATRLMATVYEALIDRAEQPRPAPFLPHYLYQSSENRMSILYSTFRSATYSAVIAGISMLPFAIRELGPSVGFVECDFEVNIVESGEIVLFGRVFRIG